MSVKVTLAAVAAGVLLLTAASCDSTEPQDDCEWELMSSVQKPGPRPGGGGAGAPKINTVKPGKAPAKMPSVNRTSKPVPMPNVKPSKPGKAPKGRHYTYDCD